MQTLILEDTNFDDDAALAWADRSWSGLQTLHLSDCSALTGTGVIDLLSAALPQLENLYLGGVTKISSEQLFKFTGQRLPPNLKKLGCRGFPFKDKHIRVLAHALPISCCSLDLAECDKLTDKSLKHLQNSPNSFISLALGGPCLTPTGLNSLLANKGKSLQQLDLSSTAIDRICLAGSNREDNTFMKVDEELLCKIVWPEKLQEIDLSGCSQSLDDLHFSPTLRRLTLDETDITDAGLFKLAKSYPNLRRLSLQRCFQLTDDGIANFLAKAPKRLATLHLGETAYAGSALPKSINELTLTGCQEMTFDAIHGLAEERGEGTWKLDVGGIAALSAEDIEKLQLTYPNKIICSEVFTPLIDITPVQTELQVIDFGKESLENLVIDPEVTRLQLKGQIAIQMDSC